MQVYFKGSKSINIVCLLSFVFSDHIFADNMRGSPFPSSDQHPGEICSLYNHIFILGHIFRADPLSHNLCDRRCKQVFDFFLTEWTIIILWKKKTMKIQIHFEKTMVNLIQSTLYNSNADVWGSVIVRFMKSSSNRGSSNGESAVPLNA